MIVYLQMINDPAKRPRFRRLYEHYRQLMYRTAFAILRSEKDAEDAVQESLLRISKNFLKISDLECPETRNYIVIIVRSCCIDALRKRRRMPECELDPMLPAPEYDGENLLAQCMLRLPEKQRAVMILKFQYGFSTRETARALGLSVSAVEKLISRGREKLREIYESEGGVI